MKIEILATGDELRTGALIDTNSAYIADKLEQLGFEISRHSCVGDDMNALVSILNEIGSRANAAIVTGGLGPTIDDLSSEAAAIASEVPLIMNAKALKNIEAFFKKLNRPMNSCNKKQAFFPKNSEILNNPIGTAPGFSCLIKKCRFFFIPGVPVEMRKMLKEQVMPCFKKLYAKDQDISIIKTFVTFGAGESNLNEYLIDFPKHFPEVKLGTRAKFPEVQIKIYSRGKDEKKVQKLIDNASAFIMKRIEKWVFSTNGESMEMVVGRLLRENKASLAIAESCTGGLIANLITSVPGSSDYFLFSGVTYSNEAKESILGVSHETIEKYGAVSKETVKEMAMGALKAAGSTYAIATSGIAGPGGGTPDKPVGTVCVGIAGPDGVETNRFYFSIGSRIRKKEIFAMAAMDCLRRKIVS
ncbi:CinA-like protein [Candidatus Magnetomoraceae bacterium gMMP-15]